jgi:hypothetical protein
MAKQAQRRSRKAAKGTASRSRRRDSNEDTSPERFEVLEEGVSEIKMSQGWDADRIALAIGGLLTVGGLVAILIGWYGAASTGLPFEQTPYLISGGMLGVALVFLGGFIYFGYWVARLLRETREQSERMTVLLGRIAASSNGSGPSSSGTATSLVATRSGTQYHRADCVVVAGKPGLRRVTTRTRGLTPCRVCEPQS